jgi:hypothetical protein
MVIFCKNLPSNQTMIGCKSYSKDFLHFQEIFGCHGFLFLCFSVAPYIDKDRLRFAQLRDITIVALGDKSSLYRINNKNSPVLIFM